MEASSIEELKEAIVSKEAELKDLKAKLQALEEAERSAAIGQIMEAMKAKGITLDDLKSAPKAKASGKRPAKYKDHISGKEWAGTGSQPAWIKDHITSGGSLEDFLIK